MHCYLGEENISELFNAYIKNYISSKFFFLILLSLSNAYEFILYVAVS